MSEIEKYMNFKNSHEGGGGELPKLFQIFFERWWRMEELGGPFETPKKLATIGHHYPTSARKIISPLLGLIL